MAEIKDPENTIILELKDGPVTIELLPDVAPKHAERMKELARAGAYDNVAFHRVIDGFMAQTGDVQYGKMGAADFSMPTTPASKAEFSDQSFDAGVVGMARSQNPNSANAQFFIMFAPAPHLDGQYTVVGKVTSGMDVVNQIKRGTGPNGAVIGEPDVMTSVTVTD